MSAHLRRILVLNLLPLSMAIGAAAQTTASYEVVHRFSGATGSYPYGFLIQGSDGALYGTVRWGPGLVFRMSLDGTVTFLRQATEAANEPIAGLVQGADGAFYGTTSLGAGAGGTVFRLTATGELTVLHAFTATAGSVTTDGGHPTAALFPAADGMLYGTTRYGGTQGEGVVFRITPDGDYTTLRSLPHAPNPPDRWISGPVMQVAGEPDTLYGMTRRGGAHDGGTIFRTPTADPDPSSLPVVLHDFAGAPDDGALPDGGLLVGPDGNFYGTTIIGGAWNKGTAFKATPLGVVTILHSFAGGSDDGEEPAGGVILARDGNFYGTTYWGGAHNLGTVYRMTPAGDVTVLHSFARGSDGASPYAGLVETSDGTIYGMTAGGGGGPIGSGTIFRIRFIPPPAPVVGFDGDGIADMPLYDATTGTWRILTSSSDFRSSLLIYWGGPEYTPVPADYDGDGRLDVAVYHAGRGLWYVLTSSSHFTSASIEKLGGVGWAPAPGDFDNDRRADPAVYRRTTGQWAILKSVDGTPFTLTVAAGGVPVRGDFDGDFVADPTVYVPATGTWRVLTSTSSFASIRSIALGGSSDTPVPGDYDADHKTDPAVYNVANGNWTILQSSTDTTMTIGWGGTGYTPVPGDYDADGKNDLAVYTAATGAWYVLQSSTNFSTVLHALWGQPIDTVVTTLPVRTAWNDALRATDYDGDGASDLAVYEPSTGVWSILTSSSHFAITRTITLGGATDTPVPGDYDGDGIADAATFNAATGLWTLQRTSHGALTLTLGSGGDIPVPRDYDGDGITDPGVYTPWTGAWRFNPSTFSASFATTRIVAYGAAWWVPYPADFDGDGIADLGLYDQATGRWQSLLARNNYTSQLTMLWGGPGQTAVPGDYDGDGAIDFTVCRTATRRWWVLKSGFTYTTAFGSAWSTAIDTPRSADYDGDGIADMASYDSTTGEWRLLLSSSFFTLTLDRTLGGAGFVLPRTP